MEEKKRDFFPSGSRTYKNRENIVSGMDSIFPAFQP